MPGLLMLGTKQDHRGAVPVQAAPTPASNPRGCGRGPTPPKLLQWVIPALTGGVLVVNARMGEQQRPIQVTGGLLGRLNQDEPPDQGRRYRSGFGLPRWLA
jgi:hypothetical protein